VRRARRLLAIAARELLALADEIGVDRAAALAIVNAGSGRSEFTRIAEAPHETAGRTIADALAAIDDLLAAVGCGGAGLAACGGAAARRRARGRRRARPGRTGRAMTLIDLTRPFAAALFLNRHFPATARNPHDGDCRARPQRDLRRVRGRYSCARQPAVLSRCHAPRDVDCGRDYATAFHSASWLCGQETLDLGYD